MNIVERIRTLMAERDWTRYRLEQESGLSKSTISNLFRRRGTVPSIETLEPIAKAFGMTLSQFFAEGEAAFPLTREQRLLLDKWAVLNPEQRTAMLALLDTMKP